MLAVLDRSLPIVTPSWMHPSVTDELPPGNHVALAPGVLVLRVSVRRAAELDDVELTPPPAPPPSWEPPSWHSMALCAGVDQEKFFSEDRRRRVTLANEAKRLCRGCPSAEDCLIHALRAREEFGIWAGTSGLRRKAMLARIDGGESTVQSEVDAWLAKPR